MGAMDKSPTPIHVFRAGRHTTAAGEPIEFSQADLEATVAGYDPALHQAPLVIGHPEGDAPAYGWATRFELRGGELYALADQVRPEFAEGVNSGAYKQRSLAWYRPTDAANPKPGIWYPRHIGFLGAQPPAIKGLEPVQFREGGEPVEIEFAEWEDVTNASLWRRLREWFIGQFGQETADRVVPSWDVSSLEQGAQDELRQSQTESAPIPSFSEPSHHQETTVTPEEKSALEAENAKLKADLAARDAADQAAAAKARHAEAVQFCEGLIQAGKLLPAHKDTTVALYELTARSAPVEFGEGDAKTSEAPLAKFKAMLEAGPKLVEFSEVAGGQSTGAGDDDPAVVAAKAVEFAEAEAKSGRHVSAAEAVRHVTGGQR